MPTLLVGSHITNCRQDSRQAVYLEFPLHLIKFQLLGAKPLYEPVCPTITHLLTQGGNLYFGPYLNNFAFFRKFYKMLTISISFCRIF